MQTVLATPAFLAMKNRIPPSHNSSFRPLNLSFTKKAPFWIFQFANFMQSLAFFLPQLWIPSFAKALDLPSFAGPLGLCMLNIGAIGGYLLHGFLVDRFEVTAVMLLSSTVAGIERARPESSSHRRGGATDSKMGDHAQVHATAQEAAEVEVAVPLPLQRRKSGRARVSLATPAAVMKAGPEAKSVS